VHDTDIVENIIEFLCVNPELSPLEAVRARILSRRIRKSADRALASREIRDDFTSLCDKGDSTILSVVRTVAPGPRATRQYLGDMGARLKDWGLLSPGSAKRPSRHGAPVVSVLRLLGPATTIPYNIHPHVGLIDRVEPETLVRFEEDDHSMLGNCRTKGSPYVRRLVLNRDVGAYSTPSTLLRMAAGGYWPNLREITIVFSRTWYPTVTEWECLDKDLAHLFGYAARFSVTFVDAHLTEGNPFPAIRDLAKSLGLLTPGPNVTLVTLTEFLFSRLRRYRTHFLTRDEYAAEVGPERFRMYAEDRVWIL
jgi:hypothetical protein